MTERHARWPWLAFGAFVAMAAGGTVLQIVNDSPFWDDAGFVVAFFMFGAVGAIIVSRDPGNRIGLLFLWGCCFSAMAFACSETVTYVYGQGVRSGFGVGFLAFLGDAGWILGILPVLILLPLLFPDGHLPSPRWRVVAAGGLGLLLVMSAGALLGSRTFIGSVEGIAIENPFYQPALRPLFEVLEKAFWIYIVLLGTSALSLILRFRRSEGVERQQIKWFAFAIVFLLIETTLSEIFAAVGIQNAFFDTFLVAVAFLALPVSVGIAVLKYRLFDLDVVIRKTVLYGMLVALATAVYVVVVVGLGTLIGRESSFLTMVAAVIVAVGFQPARLRLAHIANQIVYGQRATPYEVLSEFSERVGEAYAADDVLPRMARVVAEGVNAERADVWLKIGDELRVSASWPSTNGHDAARVPIADGSLPRIDGADVAYPVEHRGELLGALAVTKPSTDPLTPNDAKLVEDLAAQAGLVLRNVRLTEELRARLDDLRAAQKRIVVAQDEERRRLERNIHDGAQQQLVALAVKARLARGLTEKDPAKAAQILSQLEVDTTSALEDLRDLARGIYPPLLADRGLAAALEAQARKAPMPVTIDVEGLGRYSHDIEAAAYFSVLEALQNVAKHAGARSANVRLAEDDGAITVEVVDDGRGFDPAVGRYGSGLQGIADRLEALDGTLEVRSAAGDGTSVIGRIPVSS